MDTTQQQKCLLGCLLALAALWLARKCDHVAFRLGKVDRTIEHASSFQCKPLSQKERLDAFGDLQSYTHKIFTSSGQAQKAFDTGLMLAYGFNQPEALRSFHQAMDEDQMAPAAYWGKAYALGPMLNKIAGSSEGGAIPVFSRQELEEGRKAVEKGMHIADDQMTKLLRLPKTDTHETLKKLLERDKAYLQGISHVFLCGATHGPPFLAGAKAYAQALEEWAETHPEDTDALALAAEALANLQPWDFWDAADPPQPRPVTLKVLSLLRAALNRNPAHPLALHIMIHATEAAAPGPSGAGQATFAADGMRSAASMIGHLQHMPSHTYLNTGHWHKGVEVNEASLQVDFALATRCVEAYLPFHNAQMLIYNAMSGAEKETAELWASRMAEFPKKFGPSYETDGKDHIMLPFVWLRFASWRPLLNLKPEDLDPSRDGVQVSDQAKPFSKAVYHLVRTYAHAAVAASFPVEGLGVAGSNQRSNEVQWAFDELRALEFAVDGLENDAVTGPDQTLGAFSLAYKATSTHGLLMAQARLCVLEGNFDAAVTHLNAARHIEVATGYMEPPPFSQFSMECLGWVFLQSGHLSKAAQAYTQGLQRFSRSPWALTGLKQVWEAAAQLEQSQLSNALSSLHSTLPSKTQQQQPQQPQEQQVAVSIDKQGQAATSRELVQGGGKELKSEQNGGAKHEVKRGCRKLFGASSWGERENNDSGGNDHKGPSAGPNAAELNESELNAAKPNVAEFIAAEPNAAGTAAEPHVAESNAAEQHGAGTSGDGNQAQGKGRVWTKNGGQLQGGPSNVHVFAAGIPTAEEVDALLSELSAESGAMAQLSSSCPSFSEPL